MSAWIVSKRHIDHIVTAAIARELIAPSEADETGEMLWRECLRSVSYRYPDDKDGEWPGHRVRVYDVDTYCWRETPALDDLWLIRTLECYAYQSSEHPEWTDSEAYRLFGRLRGTCVGELDQSGRSSEDKDGWWGWKEWPDRC